MESIGLRLEGKRNKLPHVVCYEYKLTEESPEVLLCKFDVNTWQISDVEMDMTLNQFSSISDLGWDYHEDEEGKTRKWVSRGVRLAGKHTYN